jgi:hypothetical protein
MLEEQEEEEGYLPKREQLCPAPRGNNSPSNLILPRVFLRTARL